MSKKVIMTGTLGVMTEASIKHFEELVKKAAPDAEYKFLYDEPQDDETIIKECKGAKVIITQFQQFNENIYKALVPELTGFIAYGIGFNCADIDAATKYGVKIANIPDYCTDEVANHAVTLILTMQRRIPNLIKWIEEGKWAGGYKAVAPKKRFAGSTIGLYGFGRIPRLVAKSLQGFGVKIIAHDPFVPAEAMKEAGVESVDFDTLLAESDYISLHAPALPGTIGKFNKEAFAKMKPSAVLVNTARGALVDPEALYDALTTGKIDSAALDAYIAEPPAGIEEKILKLPNVLSTPHVGYYSDTAFEELMVKTADEVARLLNDEKPRSFVNPKVMDK